MRDEELQLVVFAVDEQRFALPLGGVERVVHAAAVTPVPGAPPSVRGILNVQGEMLPVLDLRVCLDLRPRALALSDQFLVLRTARRRIALLVDQTLEVLQRRVDACRPLASVAPGLERYRGAVECAGQFVLIQDPEAFLTAHDGLVLDAALAAGAFP